MGVKSCDNCRMNHCHCENFELWKPIECPNCGGALSETRYNDGKPYRHCFACHFEFYLEGGEE